MALILGREQAMFRSEQEITICELGSWYIGMPAASYAANPGSFQYWGLSSARLRYQASKTCLID